jgi:anti-anti-sigma regulatory factor
MTIALWRSFVCSIRKGENMATKKRKQNAAGTQARVITLAGTLDIGGVESLRATLLAALDLGAPVTLDATATEQIDSAGLQLLCAFARSAAAQGLPVTWSATTDRFQQHARLLGLVAALGLPGA